MYNKSANTVQRGMPHRNEHELLKAYNVSILLALMEHPEILISRTNSLFFVSTKCQILYIHERGREELSVTIDREWHLFSNIARRC